MKKHLPELFIVCLLVFVSLAGILSMDFSKSSSYVNQYGDTVRLFGSGIYKADSYFKAPIFIGTDIAVLFFLVPMLIAAIVKDIKTTDYKTKLRLVSVEAVALYYACSLCFGVKYNRIFLLYAALFALLFFTFIRHMRNCCSCRISYEMKKGDVVFLVFSGISLCVAWLPDIIPTIITGEPLALIENYTTEATYILDLAIISPLCFIALFLLKKKDSLGTIIYSLLLQSIIVVAVMMITQSAVQFLSGIDLPLAVPVTKSLIFVALGIVAVFLQKRLMLNVYVAENR